MSLTANIGARNGEPPMQLSSPLSILADDQHTAETSSSAFVGLDIGTGACETPDNDSRTDHISGQSNASSTAFSDGSSRAETSELGHKQDSIEAGTTVPWAATAPITRKAHTHRPHANAEEDIGDDLSFSYGWVDGPPECVRFCGLLLWCCGRHPSQKGRFIIRARTADAAKVKERKIGSVTRLGPAGVASAQNDRSSAAHDLPSTDHDTTYCKLAVDVAGPVDAFVLGLWWSWDAFMGRVQIKLPPETEAPHVSVPAVVEQADNVTRSGVGGDDEDPTEVVVGGMDDESPQGDPPIAAAAVGRTLGCCPPGARLCWARTARVAGRLAAGTRRADAYADRGNPARRAGCCGCYPCTLQAVLAYSAAGTYVAYCLFYLLLFGLYQVRNRTQVRRHVCPHCLPTPCLLAL